MQSTCVINTYQIQYPYNNTKESLKQNFKEGIVYGVYGQIHQMLLLNPAPIKQKYKTLQLKIYGYYYMNEKIQNISSLNMLLPMVSGQYLCDKQVKL